MSERNSVPFATVEGVIDRLDRINRRLIAIIVLLIVLLVGSNVIWVIYESQFQTISSETSIDSWQDGDNNLVSGGDLYYGTAGENQN